MLRIGLNPSSLAAQDTLGSLKIPRGDVRCEFLCLKDVFLYALCILLNSSILEMNSVVLVLCKRFTAMNVRCKMLNIDKSTNPKAIAFDNSGRSSRPKLEEIACWSLEDIHNIKDSSRTNMFQNRRSLSNDVKRLPCC
jgi:hypothetical protein